MRRAASSSSIQRASAAGTKWIVPRIGQVRRIAPRSMAASIVLALARLVRRPTAHSEWPYSCAWTAPRCVTTSAGSPVVVAARYWLASRLASRSSGVIASSYGALPSRWFPGCRAPGADDLRHWLDGLNARGGLARVHGHGLDMAGGGRAWREPVALAHGDLLAAHRGRCARRVAGEAAQRVDARPQHAGAW